MNIKITVPYNYEIIIPMGEKSGELITALAGCLLVKEEGYGKDKKWISADVDEKLKIEFISESFQTPIADPIKKAMEATEIATTRWLDSYREAETLKAKVKELEGKLNGIKETATPTTETEVAF